MLYSWYSADYTSDPDFEDATPEERANPSMGGWPDGLGYLEQQRLRLPSHKYRRLHLNLPGMPDGAAFDAAAVMDCIPDGRKQLPRQSQQPGPNYTAFVDMSGGSSDDAVLAIAHKARDRNVVVLDLVVSQTGRPPFNPRHAVKKFAELIKGYGCSGVVGDLCGRDIPRRLQRARRYLSKMYPQQERVVRADRAQVERTRD